MSLPAGSTELEQPIPPIVERWDVAPIDVSPQRDAMSREHECETCGRSNDSSDMRRVTVKEEVGNSVGNSRSNRRGNNHSMSFGGSSPTRLRTGYSNSNTSRSSNRRYFRRRTVWVCDDCSNPPGTVLPLGTLIKRWTIFAVIAVGLFFVIHGVSWVRESGSGFDLSRFAARGSHSPATDSRDATAAADEPAALAAPAPARKVKFSASHEVVQSLPKASSQPYEKCSATVTDHCHE